jgi:hypothetical protein
MARAAAAVCAEGAIAGLQPVLHMLLAYVAFLRGKARRMAWHGIVTFSSFRCQSSGVGRQWRFRALTYIAVTEAVSAVCTQLAHVH